MRFGYLETMTDPAYMRPLAIAAEDAGYDAFVVPDSICYPEHSDSKYPYTENGDRKFLAGKPFIEIFAGSVPEITSNSTSSRWTPIAMTASAVSRTKTL